MRTAAEDPPTRRTDWLGSLSLISCPVLLVAYMAARHGLAPATGVRAVAALYFLGVVPGYLVQRHLFRVRAATPFETMLSSLLLGMLATPLLWYLVCWLGPSAILGPLVVALGLAGPAVWLWHRRAGRAPSRPRPLVLLGEAHVLWLALLLTVLWSYRTTPVETHGGQVFLGRNAHDHAIHAAMVAELSRGVPPQAVPSIAGARKFGYHDMPDVWCDLMGRAAGAHPLDAYFGIALTFRYVFVLLGCYLALVNRFGRPAATLGTACLLGVAGHPSSHAALANGLMHFIPGCYPNGFGVMATFLVVYYVSITGRQSPGGPLLAASIVSAVLLWYKANFALVVGPAVAVVGLAILGRRRDYRWLAACLILPGLLAAIRYWQLSTADVRATLMMAPGAFLQHQWEQLLHCRWDDLSVYLSTPSAVFGAVCRTVHALPAVLRWPATFVLCMVKQFHLDMAILAYAVLCCGLARRRLGAGSVDLLIVLILILCAIGFVILPVQKGLVWNVSIHLFALVHALLFALLGPVVCDVVRRLRQRRKAVVAVGATVLLVALSGNALSLARRSVYYQPVLSSGISEGLYACYRHIEASTPPDAVILQPRLCKGNQIAGMVTQRRIVLEDGDTWRLFYDVDSILSDLRAFYAQPDGVSSRAILDRYGVDYVVAEPPLCEAATDELLTAAYRNGNAVVYRVHDHLKTPLIMRAARRPGSQQGRPRAKLAGH